MSSVVFDSGALIAFERKDRRALAVLAQARRRGVRIAIPAGVVGQVWRDGRSQVPLARLLGSPIVDIEPLTDREARAAGQLCGVRGTRDVIDASVVLCAQRRQAAVLTSDADDLLRLDPRVRIVAV